MKIKVGDYVRTKNGHIAKVLGTDHYDDDIKPGTGRLTALFLDNAVEEIDKDIYESCFYIFKDCKVSPNIIDLIDEGDYIRIITSAYFEPIYYSYGKLVIRNDIDISKYSNKFIAEVITKEEIERRSYKVGE